MYYDVSNLNDFTRFSIFNNGEECFSLNCEIQVSRSSINYKFYQSEKDFDISISKSSGLLFINTNGHILDSKLLQSALQIVSNEMKKINLNPQINIANSNVFLQKIANSCNFKKVPTLGKFKFAIWKYFGG